MEKLELFYNKNRYEKYSIDFMEKQNKSKDLLLSFLKKHLGVKTNEGFIENTNEIKKGLGTIIGSITIKLYNIFSSLCSKLNIYSYEFAARYKARKIFLAEEFDFVSEDRMKKEIFLFLLNYRSPKLKEVLEHIKPLDLDADFLSNFLDIILGKIDPIEDSLEYCNILYKDMNSKEKNEHIEKIDYLESILKFFLEEDEEA